MPKHKILLGRKKDIQALTEKHPDVFTVYKVDDAKYTIDGNMKWIRQHAAALNDFYFCSDMLPPPINNHKIDIYMKEIYTVMHATSFPINCNNDYFCQWIWLENIEYSKTMPCRLFVPEAGCPVHD